MNRKNIFQIILALSFCTSCNFNTDTNNGNKIPNLIPGSGKSVDTSIVLSVGNVNITGYEFERNLDRFKSEFRQKNSREAGADAIKTWINEFIDNTYLLADAYNKGYDKDKYIDSVIKNARQSLAVQMQLPQFAQMFHISNRDGYVKEQPQQIIDKAQLQFDNNVINALGIRLGTYNYGAHYSFKKGDFKQLLKYPLVSYLSPQGNRLTITVNDFFDYYNTLIVKMDVDNAMDIRKNLEGQVYTLYTYDNAVKAGITQQPLFMLTINNLKNNMIYKKFEATLANDPPVTASEISRIYQLKKNEFTQPTDVTASIYYFVNKHAASAFGGMIRRTGYMPNSQFQGMIKGDRDINVNYKNNHLPDTLKKMIFNMPDGKVSRIIHLANEYVLIKRESSTGSRIQNLDEVKDKVIKIIEDGRIAKNKQIELARLKKIYPLKNNINLNSLIN